MDYDAHHLLHHQSKPPKKPSVDTMRKVVEDYGKTGGDREFNQGTRRRRPVNNLLDGDGTETGCQIRLPGRKRVRTDSGGA